MRILAVTLALLAGWPVSGAPLGVSLRAEKNTFLVYEPIPIHVTVRNISGRPVQLEDAGDRSWLEFLITDADNSLVPAAAQPDTRGSLVIGPGQSMSRTIDLLPLYELRERGQYRVEAVLHAAGGSVVSAPLRFNLTHGRELWSEVVGLPPTSDVGAAEEYRTYSLLARRGEREDSLYICVRDEPRQIVYSLVALGPFLSTSVPQALVDRAGHLHVLFQNGPRSFGYAAVNAQAQSIARGGYSDFRSSPRLVIEGGVVSVRGGEQVYPERETPINENPPLPPKPKSKRHWWWPFGPRS